MFFSKVWVVSINQEKQRSLLQHKYMDKVIYNLVLMHKPTKEIFQGN